MERGSWHTARHAIPDETLIILNIEFALAVLGVSAAPPSAP